MTTVSGDRVPDDIGGLIGYIVVTHHTYLRRELPRLTELMAEVEAANGEAHPELHDVAATLAALSEDLIPHLVKEEKILFPLTIELLGAVEPPRFHCGTLLNPIRVMNVEHDQVEALLATLRHRTAGYEPPEEAHPAWRALYAGLAELEADIQAHVHLESDVLFPRIIGLEASLG